MFSALYHTLTQARNELAAWSERPIQACQWRLLQGISFDLRFRTAVGSARAFFDAMHAFELALRVSVPLYSVGC